MNNLEEAQNLYEKYAVLKEQTTLVAHIIKPGQDYEAQYINPELIIERKQIAKELFTKHRDVLELDPVTWYDIELDSK